MSANIASYVNFSINYQYLKGDKWDENDGDYTEYRKKLLPTDEDEKTLKDLFKQEWIEYRAPTRKMIDSGIGQLK